jgi:hypothetical protein
LKSRREKAPAIALFVWPGCCIKQDMHLNRLLLLMGLVVPLAGACGGGAIGGQPGASCQQLQDQYSNAYPAALACDPGAANQCQQFVKSGPNCDCEGAVQDPTALDAIRAQMIAQGCVPQNASVCPPCAPLGPASCVANDGGAGTCMYSLQ